MNTINNIAEDIMCLKQELEKVSAIPDTSATTPLDFHVITIKHECDNRAYCDSKTTSVFIFSRPISREEFSSFLKEMGKEEKAKGAWYAPYTIIKGDGNRWAYIYVSPSTH